MRSRLIVLVLDSAAPNLVAQWASDGLLPNIARLMRDGVSAPIATPPGVLEGAIWPTILTGSHVSTHGMYAYKQIVPGTYDVEIAMMADRLPVPPFWAHLGDARLRVAAVDAPFSLPVKNLNGIQVTNWGAHDLWCGERSSWPESLVGDLVRRFGEYPVPTCDQPGRSMKDYEDLRIRLLDGTKRKTQLLRYCRDLEHWDFFFGVFSESHCAGHQFWHFTDPTHPRFDPEASNDLRRCIRDVYGAIDAGVGELLEGLMPETHVLLLLSHGMGSYHHGSHLLDEIIERLGVGQTPKEAPVPGGRDHAVTFREAAWGARRVFPNALRQRAKQMVPHAWTQTLWRWAHTPPPPPHPWKSKRVFQLPESNMTGLLRINLKGREPNGTVSPGAEYESLCSRLRESLMLIENLDKGSKAVQWVARARDLYQGKRLNDLPDLFVEWDHSAPIERVGSPEIGTVEGVFSGHRTGSHFQGGLLIALGPRFRKGTIEGINTVDLAPTILSFFGVPSPSTYEGRSCLELLRGTVESQQTGNR